MEKHSYSFVLVFCIVISLSLVSFISCLIAETKKAKIKDLKVDGKICYLPGSQAYGYGIAALVCLAVAQVFGNLQFYRNFYSREKRNNCIAKKPRIATILLVFSWSCFGVGAILLSAATSMSRRQAYGKGWLDQECYLVKDGVFIGSGALVLVSIGSTLGAAIMTTRKSQAEQGRRVHAQIG